MAISSTTNPIGPTPSAAPEGYATDETLLAANNKAYGRNVQHLVFGIHGTANNPSHIDPLTQRVAGALGRNEHSSMYVDTSFDWSKEAGIMNQPGGREKVGDRFAKHLDQTLTELKANGQLDPTKPIQLTVLGFSHGGNVAIGATPEIAEVLQKHGLRTNTSLHLVTVSTPAYNDGGPEDPGTARKGATDRGFHNVHHTHFATRGDGVIRGALGDAFYDGPGHPEKNRRGEHVYNYELQGKGFLRPISSHGAAQDDAKTAQNLNNQGEKVAGIVAARSLDIHNRQGRPRGRLAEGEIDNDGIAIAMVHDYERDPITQQIRSAVDSRTAKGDNLHVTSSEVAALAYAARRDGFERVGDVVRGKEGQLFATDHPQADHPAARFVRAESEIASLPPNAAWQKLGEAPATVATAAPVPGIDIEQPHRGQRMV
jgi:hypothetical protein